MRNLFLSLVFINVLYFAWAHWVDVPPPPVVDTSVKLPPLKLADEPAGKPAGPSPGAAVHPTALAAKCLSVGPFNDLDSSARATAILKAKGFATTQRAVEGQGADGYWVYVAGLTSQADADRTFAALEKAGIKDALLMPEAADAGRRISIGLYTDKSRAAKRAAAASAAGIKAEIGPRKIPVAVYWVDLSPPEGVTAVPLQDLFAEGVSTRVGVAPCAAALPATATAVVTAPAATAAPVPMTAPPARPGVPAPAAAQPARAQPARAQATPGTAATAGTVTGTPRLR